MGADKGKEKIMGAGASSSSSSSSSVEKAKASGRQQKGVPDTARNRSEFGQKLQQGLSLLFNNQLFSDVTLLLGSKKEQVYAHRGLLAGWSPKLKELFDKNPTGPAVELPSLKEHNVENFKLLLEYMYKGSCTQKITADNAMSLLELAHEYGVSPVKEECGVFLFNSSKEIQAGKLLEIVEEFQTRKLETLVAEHLATNFESLLEENTLWDLNVSTWVELLKSDKVQIAREEELFNAALRFADKKAKNKKERKQILEQLLPHIRYAFCSPQFLVEEVEQNEELMAVQALKDGLYYAFRWRVCPKAANPLILERRCGSLNVSLQWDPSQPFTYGIYTISEDGFEAHKTTMPGTIYILRTTEMLEAPGAYYYEILVKTLSGSSEVHIGLATTSFAFNSAYLRANGSYFYDRTSGIMQGNQTITSAPSLANGDRIGFLVDFSNSTLEIFRNDQSVYVFKNIPYQLWPCIAARDVGTKLELVCGKTPSLYNLSDK
ncbi:BTB/POZ domain containing protein [Balamuthia mandrillaris]